jgi:hypothetical protein
MLDQEFIWRLRLKPGLFHSLAKQRKSQKTIECSQKLCRSHGVIKLNSKIALTWLSRDDKNFGRIVPPEAWPGSNS